MKKIILVVIAVPLIAVGTLWLLGSSSSLPTTDEAKNLVGGCLVSGHTREQCLCVFDGAKERMTDREMEAAWEIRLGDRQYFGEKDEVWVHEESDRLYAEFARTLGPNQTISYQQRKAFEAEAARAARAEPERIKGILDSIISDCGFR